MLSLLVPSCLLFFSERGAIAPSWRSCACLLLSCQPHTRPCPFYLFFSSLATSPLQKNDLHPGKREMGLLRFPSCVILANIQTRGGGMCYPSSFGNIQLDRTH